MLRRPWSEIRCPGGHGLPRGSGVLDELDQCVVCPQRERPSLSALEAPERLVLRAVEFQALRRAQTQNAHEESAASAPGREPRASPSARRRPTPRVVGRAVRALSGRSPSARSERLRGRERRPGGSPRDPGARSAAACRPRPHAPSPDRGPRPRRRSSSSRRRTDASRRDAGARADSGTRTARAGTRPGGRPATSRWMPRAGRPCTIDASGPANRLVPPAGASPRTSRYQRCVPRRSTALIAIWLRRIYRRCSRPTVSGSASPPTLRTASRTPGMNERRSVESWRIDRVCPSPPKITS